MMMNVVSSVMIIAALCACFVDGQVYVQPEHVHLSLGNSEYEMVVTWTTEDKTENSVVEYGINTDLTVQVTGHSTLFVDGGKKQRSMHIHRVTLPVEPGKSYFYHCGCPHVAWSAVYYFVAPKAPNASWSPRLAVYGDLGNVNSRSLAYIQDEVHRRKFNAIIHVGDFAYDMEDNDAKVGDEFMHMIEPIAAYVPYMTCPGNHERAYNYSNYVNRFSMPGGSNNSMFYSYNLGPVHFIALSTEYYFYPEFGLESSQTLYNWLLKDLEEANLPENRQIRPWIVVYGHRPLYCSNKGDDDCNSKKSVLRKGDSTVNMCGFEELFLDFGVDLYISGHKHAYERFFPVYDRQVRNGTNQPYNNARATVYVVTGSAGCEDEHGSFSSDQPAWSAFRSTDYGYTTMDIVNTTHIYLQQRSIEEKEMKVIDEFWLVKDQSYPSFYKELSAKSSPKLVNGCLNFS